MDAVGGLFCRDRGEARPSSLLLGARETKVLGEAYCDSCVRARSMRCHRCKGGLRLEDFEEGRAVTLAGRRYCEICLEMAVERGRGQSALPEGDEPDSAHQARIEAGLEDPTMVVSRRHGRYVPGKGTKIAVRARGMGGIFRGDRVRVWLDISEGGFRAILSGDFDLESRLGGSLTMKDGGSIPFEAVVKYVRPAPRHPGCVLAGCEFVAPSVDLLAFIRATMAARPVRLPGAADKRGA